MDNFATTIDRKIDFFYKDEHEINFNLNAHFHGKTHSTMIWEDQNFKYGPYSAKKMTKL